MTPSQISPREVVWLQMRGRAASRRLLLHTRPAWWHSKGLLVIDGYEQLSRITRCLAVLLTRSRDVGLLVTSHRRTCLPTLIETRVDTAIARSLLESLLPNETIDRQRFLNAARLQQMLDQYQGNLREVFMQLYDEVQLPSD